MLSAMGTFLAAAPEPMRPAYHLEWTEMWDAATAFAASGQVQMADVAGDVALAALLDEVRLQADRTEDLHHKAFLRLLAQRETDRRHGRLDQAAVTQATNKFREQQGLFTRDALDHWIAAHGLNQQSFEELMREEAQLQRLRTWAGPALDRKLTDILRLTGDYRGLLERAAEKGKLLKDMDFGDRQAAGPNSLQLLAWYCRERLGAAIPDDPEGFVQSLGFSSREDFDRALLREYLYSKHKNMAGP